MSDLEVGIMIGAVIGAFLAWGVTLWFTSREPHCLDCECEGCRILRAGIHGPSDLPQRPAPSQVPVMKPTLRGEGEP